MTTEDSARRAVHTFPDTEAPRVRYRITWLGWTVVVALAGVGGYAVGYLAGMMP